MTRNEILIKLSEIRIQRIEKESKLEAYIQKWLEGESTLSSASIEQLIETTNQQIELMKEQEERLEHEYKKQIYQEELLRQAKQTVHYQLNTSPDELITIGGTLSTSANQSHLVARPKTREELEKERINLLNSIKNKVLNKEISLNEASKLSNEINIAYGYTTPTFIDDTKPKR